MDKKEDIACLTMNSDRLAYHTLQSELSTISTMYNGDRQMRLGAHPRGIVVLIASTRFFQIQFAEWE